MLFRLSKASYWTVLLAVCLISTPENLVAQGRPAGVETSRVEVVEMSETARAFGQVVAERESAVAARVAGIAEDVPVRVGSRVAVGDILARLDTELFEIEVARAETELAIAEAGARIAGARLERAVKAFDRAESLRLNSTIADATLEDRQTALAEARGLKQESLARVGSAQNAIQRARYTLRNATIQAPFDGIVLDVSTQVGQFVSSGSEVVTLLDIGHVEVRANVPADLIEALEPGRTVSAQTGTGEMLELVLRAILPTEYTTTQARPILLEIVNPGASVAVGQSISVDLPVSEPREVVIVPKDALVQYRGGWSVFVNDAGEAAPRPIEIGAAVGGGFEVLSGLRAGEEVVIRGNERLRPGQPIAPQNARPVEAGTGPENVGGASAAGAAEHEREGGAPPEVKGAGRARDESSFVADARGERG